MTQQDTAPSGGHSIDVAIVSYFSDIGRLSATLTSLSQAFLHLQTALPAASLRVTMVDNTGDHLRRYSVQLRAPLDDAGIQSSIVYSTTNLGYGAANNLALCDSEADFVLVLNPDVLLAEDALLCALLHMQGSPDTVLIGPLASGPNGDLQYLHRRYPGVLTLLSRLLGVAYDSRDRQFFEMRIEHVSGKPFEPLLISGCCMLLTKDAWEAIDGFSDRYFLYFEDYDLSIRAASVGKLEALPAMRICHFGGGAGRKGLLHIRLFVTSAISFYRRYGWRLLSAGSPPNAPQAITGSRTETPLR